MGGDTMQVRNWFHRIKGSLKPKAGLVLRLGLLATLPLAVVLFRFLSPIALDTQGWSVADFVEHLDERGVNLRVIPGDGPCNHAYLTEDPALTWEAMQEKMTDPQYIAQWRGTVWVTYDFLGSYGDNHLSQWGKNSCQIGNFVLFGDERLLRRIEEACCSRRGWY
jgi:hypothetical protein